METRHQAARPGDAEHLLPARAVFRQSEAARAGVGSRTLYRLVERGVVERVGHGLYRRSDAPPADLDLALPRGSGPVSTVAPVTWHHLDAATFEVGRASVVFDGSEEHIGLYSAERSVAATRWGCSRCASG